MASIFFIAMPLTNSTLAIDWSIMINVLSTPSIVGKSNNKHACVFNE